MQIHWEKRFSQRVQQMKSSAIRELLKITEQPEIISFAGGLPAPELFPLKQVEIATCKVLKEQGEQALQYSATEGLRPLRELIAQRMSRGNLKLAVENVLITSGSQQALDLLGKVLINPDDQVVVEAPTYMGALQAWSPYGGKYITVPADDEGLRTDHLDEAFADDAKFIYVLPNFQNPTGVTLTEERRRTLLSKAQHYGIPIVEDDPYGELRFEGEFLPSLLSLTATEGQAGTYEGNVIHLGTFSKVMAPGMRLGWVIAAPQLINKLVQSKQGADLHTSSFNQAIAYELLQSGFIDEHVPSIRRVYRERRDAMLTAMKEHFPKGVTWTHPEGGMFLWVRLPEDIDATSLLKEAIDHQVVFVPGEPFFPNGGGHNMMRLNYSHDDPARIREGIERLAQVLQKSIVASLV
jgi:Transcriptional regulators containing a DNA-binding HTH domain and an aminotransferase domain (MocR family) and their eukaryotic orthologs